MSKKVEIRLIYENGRWKLEAEGFGFKGPECEIATSELIGDMLAGNVVREEKKPEYHVRTVRGVVKQRQNRHQQLGGLQR